MALKELEVRYATKRAKDYKLSDGEGEPRWVRTALGLSEAPAPERKGL